MKKGLEEYDEISRKAKTLTKKIKNFIKKSTRAQHKKVEILEDRAHKDAFDQAFLKHSRENGGVKGPLATVRFIEHG